MYSKNISFPRLDVELSSRGLDFQKASDMGGHFKTNFPGSCDRDGQCPVILEIFLVTGGLTGGPSI